MGLRLAVHSWMKAVAAIAALVAGVVPSMDGMIFLRLVPDCLFFF